MAETRKLAAILAADVAGYSKLAGADEERTLARLRALRSDLIDPTISVHHGRIVKRTGDGSVIEFRSVVDAVRCALEVQHTMVERNAGVALDKRIEFRIGIHLGDVVEESDGDLMGDGVNIAARLESVCEPGGVCLSEQAYWQVKGRLDLAAVDLGPTQLKNIAEPIRVYRVAGQRNWISSPASLPLPGKPSIAVLPFTNMSADAEQEFFVDGLTEDLITELSKASDLFVIARHSSFVFKNKYADLRLVARELGVRYILEGSSRRAGGRVRINAQLIDALEGGGHLWAERFDRELADIFVVQDEVVARIVEALVGKLAVSKLIERKPPASLEAYDLCVRGRFLYHRMEAEGGKEARLLFQQAIAIDPDYAEAHAYLAMTYWFGWTNWQEPVNPNRQLALQHARRGVALDPNDPFAHLVLGFVLGYEHQYEESAAEVETALRLDPNHAYTYALRADLLVMDGRPLEAITSVGQALRLDPHPPPWYYWAKGEAEYAARQYESAVATLRHESTYGTASRSILAAALAQLGRYEEARLEGRLFMADFPQFRTAEFLETQPFRHEVDRQHFAEGYRKAALPEV